MRPTRKHNHYRVTIHVSVWARNKEEANDFVINRLKPEGGFSIATNHCPSFPIGETQEELFK